MSAFLLSRSFIFTASLILLANGAQAQTGSTPQQLQAMIVDGQAQLAITDLQTILKAHPSSGVAWYLTAEAQDAVGNEETARAALNNARYFSPGLPFANQNDASALQTRLNGDGVSMSSTTVPQFKANMGGEERSENQIGVLGRIVAALGISAGLFILIIGFLYFIPSIVAFSKGTNTTTIIVLLNLFLGWTVLGWIAALLIALFSQSREQIKLLRAQLEQIERQNSA